MKHIISFLIAIFCTVSLVSNVSAKGLKVVPLVPKNNTSELFKEDKDFKSKQLILKFKKGTSQEKKDTILNLVKGNEISFEKTGDVSLIKVPKGINLKRLADILITQKEVQYVEPNTKLESTFTPADPGFKNQWYLNKIGMPTAWNDTKGNSNVIVAVVDRGVQVNHPDLMGKIVSPMDILTGRTTFSPAEHGTHVAGIIAASINKMGIAGIAPNVKIMPVNVFRGEYANVYDIVQGIYYAVDHHANIINLSLGSQDYSYALDFAVQYAASKGVLVIAAAGNESTSEDTYPAAFKTVTGVSATDSNDKVTSFSNYGKYIDLSAPGQSIYSTISGSSYQWMSGTSMAAPIVSGAAALVLSKNPALTPAQVVEVLKKSSVDLGAKGWDQYYGYGRIDVSKALQMTMGPISNLSMSTDKLNMNGTNTASFSLRAGYGNSLSFYIQNSKGKTLKTILSNQKSTGSKTSSAWNGRLDNGSYAPAGTYKVLAKASNSLQTIYKSASIQVIDNVNPAIQMGSAFDYSPKVSSRAAIPILLNKNQTVTAWIYNRNNNVVRKVLSKYYLEGGKRTVYWDGKNSKGQRMVDGNYRMVLSSTDVYKRKTANRQITIKVDTVNPKASNTLMAPLFQATGISQNTLKITANENVYVNSYVLTGKGTKIKTLSANQFHKAGLFTIGWNGTDGKNQPAAEGSYQYLLDVRDQAGNKTAIKSSWFKLQDWEKPVIGAQSSIDYRNVEPASYSYSLSKPAKVLICIYKDGQMVKTVQQEAAKGKGSNSFILDLSSGLLPDGVYKYQIKATDKYNQVGFFQGNLTVALKRPEIEVPKIAGLFDYGDSICDVHYRLSEPAHITIEVYNSDRQKIRTLVTNVSKQAGANSFQWDGYTDNGEWTYADGTSYYYKIMAKNSIGNETTVEGKLSIDDPDWLKAFNSDFVTDGSGLNQEMKLSMELSQAVKVTLEVYKGKNGEKVDNQVYNLESGTREIEYKKPVYDNLFYKLIFEDQLGNRYFYELDENNN